MVLTPFVSHAPGSLQENPGLPSISLFRRRGGRRAGREGRRGHGPSGRVRRECMEGRNEAVIMWRG